MYYQKLVSKVGHVSENSVRSPDLKYNLLIKDILQIRLDHFMTIDKILTIQLLLQ